MLCRTLEKRGPSHFSHPSYPLPRFFPFALKSLMTSLPMYLHPTQLFSLTGLIQIFAYSPYHQNQPQIRQLPHSKTVFPPSPSQTLPKFTSFLNLRPTPLFNFPPTPSSYTIISASLALLMPPPLPWRLFCPFGPFFLVFPQPPHTTSSSLICHL